MANHGVVVGHQTRLGVVGVTKPVHQHAGQPSPPRYGDYADNQVIDDAGRLIAFDEPDKVQCIVLLRKGEDTLPALNDVEDKVEELNDPNPAACCPASRSSPITTAPN